MYKAGLRPHEYKAARVGRPDWCFAAFERPLRFRMYKLRGLREAAKLSAGREAVRLRVWGAMRRGELARRSCVCVFVCVRVCVCVCVRAREHVCLDGAAGLGELAAQPERRQQRRQRRVWPGAPRRPDRLRRPARLRIGRLFSYRWIYR